MRPAPGASGTGTTRRRGTRRRGEMRRTTGADSDRRRTHAAGAGCPMLPSRPDASRCWTGAGRRPNAGRRGRSRRAPPAKAVAERRAALEHLRKVARSCSGSRRLPGSSSIRPRPPSDGELKQKTTRADQIGARRGGQPGREPSEVAGAAAGGKQGPRRWQQGNWAAVSRTSRAAASSRGAPGQEGQPKPATRAVEHPAGRAAHAAGCRGPRPAQPRRAVPSRPRLSTSSNRPRELQENPRPAPQKNNAKSCSAWFGVALPGDARPAARPSTGSDDLLAAKGPAAWARPDELAAAA